LAARKAAEAQAQAARAAQLQAEAANAVKTANGDGDVEMKDVKDENGTTAVAGNTANAVSQNGSVPPSAPAPPVIKLPLDMVDEIINQLKTSFPLLALMMEKMVDHISIRAKPNSEEDIYRFFAALLNDAMLVSLMRNI